MGLLWLALSNKSIQSVWCPFANIRSLSKSGGESLLTIAQLAFPYFPSEAMNEIRLFFFFFFPNSLFFCTQCTTGYYSNIPSAGCPCSCCSEARSPGTQPPGSKQSRIAAQFIAALFSSSLALRETSPQHLFEANPFGTSQRLLQCLPCLSALVCKERCLATCWHLVRVHQKCSLLCSAGSFHLNVPFWIPVPIISLSGKHTSVFGSGSVFSVWKGKPVRILFA